MTPRERAAKIIRENVSTELDNPEVMANAIAAAIGAAVREEREACAAIADLRAKAGVGTYEAAYVSTTASMIAGDIRARSRP